MFAVPFDLDKLEFTGEAISVMPEGGMAVAISDSGTLVYVPGVLSAFGERRSFEWPKSTLVWVDQQGKMEEIPAPPNGYASPQISPDGTKVAVVVNTEQGSRDIHIWDFNRGNIDPLTFNGNSTDPLWTPDSKRIIFVAGEGDDTGIYRKNADGTGTEELLTLVSDAGGPPWFWADKDGKTLVTNKGPLRRGFGSGEGSSRGMMGFMMRGARGRGSAPKQSPVPKSTPGSEGSESSEEMAFRAEIGTLSMEGEREWNHLLHITGSVSVLQISPDGRWIAYNSYESEGPGIYVGPYPDVESGGKWQVSTGVALSCLWSPNGRELFYTTREDGSLMAVEVETEPTFKKGKTEFLFKPIDIGLGRRAISAGIDISQDGKRFLMVKPVETAEDESQAEEPTVSRPNKIIIVSNWFEELKQKVPVE